jgi:tyrosine-protein phosphatase
MSLTQPIRPIEPYENGPIEILPNLFLGAEESMWRWDVWARSRRVRVLNVAQEIDDPFDQSSRGKGKEKVRVAQYPAEQGRPEVQYAHLRWSHGEAGLAEVDEHTRLEDVVNPSAVEGRETWRFWEAIRWCESGRLAGEPVLIQCVWRNLTS